MNYEVIINWIFFCVQSYVLYKLIIWEILVTMDAWTWFLLYKIIFINLSLCMPFDYWVHFCNINMATLITLIRSSFIINYHDCIRYIPLDNSNFPLITITSSFYHKFNKRTAHSHYPDHKIPVNYLHLFLSLNGKQYDD